MLRVERHAAPAAPTVLVGVLCIGKMVCKQTRQVAFLRDQPQASTRRLARLPTITRRRLGQVTAARLRAGCNMVETELSVGQLRFPYTAVAGVSGAERGSRRST